MNFQLMREVYGNIRCVDQGFNPMKMVLEMQTSFGVAGSDI